MGILEGFRRASRAISQGPGPARYSAAGKIITCDHCEGQLFHEGQAQLNTAVLTFLDLDWANKTATTLFCHECGRVQWYAKRPGRVS